MYNRCVVTGLGVVCPIGNNLQEAWDNALKGVPGSGDVTSIEVEGCYTKTACEVKGYNVKKAELDLVSDFCLTAVEEAITDSGVIINDKNNKKTGVIVGSCTGGALTSEKVYKALIEGNKSVDRKEVFQMPISSMAVNIAHYFNIKGYISSVGNACAAGTLNIGYACDLIEQGILDIVIVCGADTLSSLVFSGFHSLHALANGACAPLSASDGINLGEGAGAIIIESIDHAKSRNARIYCVVSSVGVSSDAHHITAPHPEGVGQRSAMRSALQLAGVSVDEVGYINTHGTGTPVNDSTEKESIRSIFGNNVFISSTKSMTGHCLGAAGTIEAVFTIKSLYDSIVPPTINFKGDDDSGLNIVIDTAKKMGMEYALSNSFAFGGNNASILLKQYNDDVIGKESFFSADKRIAITGLGVITDCVEGVDEYINKVNNFKNKSEYGSEESSSAYAIKNNTYKIKSALYRKMDRLGKYLVISGIKAINDSKIDFDVIDKNRIGCIIGTASGPVTSIATFVSGVVKSGPSHGSAFVFPNTVYNAAGGFLSICLGIKGYSATVNNGNMSGIESICYSSNVIKHGLQENMLACGNDEISDVVEKLYDIIGNKVYPLGEGGTAIMLEDYESACKRNATIYAEVAGYFMTHEPLESGDVSISESLLSDAVIGAVKAADISIDDIDFIIGFGETEAERKCYTKLFAHCNKKISVVNIKPIVGDCRAVGSALQVVHGALVLDGNIPKDIASDYSVGKGIVVNNETKYGVIIGHSFGGSVMALILKK